MTHHRSDITVQASGANIPSGVYVVQPFSGSAVGETIDIYRLTRSQRRKLKSTTKWALLAIFGTYTVIGVAFTSVYIAMNFGLLNVRGSSMERDDFFKSLPKSEVLAATVSKTASPDSCVKAGSYGEAEATCAWNSSDEWSTVRAGIIKDKDVILDVSRKTGVSARMIAASISPEQLRFFSSEREAYKKYFEPLKVLGSMSQFSYGIAGIKLDTAKLIEQYAVDRNSPFYAGDGMAALIAYPEGANKNDQRLTRLTGKSHYYSYVYTALFLKEIQSQWSREGYDVAERPDVLATLFNLGFGLSRPKPNPAIGGTNVTLNGETYSFGELATRFYRSEELTALFPRP
jgi:hypothetical protein